MKILIVSPLYPPDIAEPAPYVKEVAQRLSKRNAVTILTYASIPEEIENVTIVTVDKTIPLPIRLLRFTYKLWKLSGVNQIIYTQNGPSVELPVLFIPNTKHSKLIVRISDEKAHTASAKKILRNFIEKKTFQKANMVLISDTDTQSYLESFMPKNIIKIIDALPERPEILPFAEYPMDGIALYEKSFENHVKTLEEIFTHV